MSELVDCLRNVYILCLCEGGAEMAVMNMLLDNNKLIFKRENLIRGCVHPRMDTTNIERKFLKKSYDKTVVILRILDSKNEKFKLNKPYKEMFEVKKCLTKPEIEILVIHDCCKLKEYIKVKSTIKPSLFCKTHLKLKDIKSKEFVNRYFDIDKLLVALKSYKEKSSNDHYSIYDLVIQ